MIDANVNEVPVWTLAAHDLSLPSLDHSGTLSPERLDELRTVLATLAEAPIATLEAHPLPKDVDLTGGLRLSSASPLAEYLSQVVDHLPFAASNSRLTSGGEALYRMVLPSKVAAQVGAGLLKPMASKAGGIHGALVGSSGIAAQARFIPVAGGTATTGGAAAGIGALTIAGPLMVAAVAACASVHTEHQRQQAIRRITELLEKIHQDRLDDERNNLDGCRSSIDKASAILLDRGSIGEALGLGPAVYTIETAVATAKRRVGRWKRTLDRLADGRVELNELNQLFVGLADENGEFHAHLELARVAIAMKRHVIVLQAVEQAQLNLDNTFERFVKVLKQDQDEVDQLDSEIDSVLLRLSRLNLDRTHGVRDFAFSSAQVDGLLRASRRLRALGDDVVGIPGDRKDLAIEIARATDRSVVVFPALSAAA